MSELIKIFQQAKDDTHKLGSAASEKLIRNLRAYRKRQFWIFISFELFVVGGVIYCAYCLAHNPAQTKQIQVLSGLIGIGTGGGIEVMRRTWKEWSRTDLLLLLVEDATAAQIVVLTDTLIKKFG